MFEHECAPGNECIRMWPVSPASVARCAAWAWPPAVRRACSACRSARPPHPPPSSATAPPRASARGPAVRSSLLALTVGPRVGNLGSVLGQSSRPGSESVDELQLGRCGICARPQGFPSRVAIQVAARRSDGGAGLRRPVGLDGATHPTGPEGRPRVYDAPSDPVSVVGRRGLSE